MSQAATSTTLAVPQLVTVLGDFPPPPGESGGVPGFTLGMLQSFAGLYQAFGAPTSSGQVLSVESNVPLYSVYGQSYGASPAADFTLPDLDGVVAIGGDPGQPGQGTLGMTWLIAFNSGGTEPPVPFAGMLALFGGTFAPDGWLVADGSLLSTDDYDVLFETIGTSFGGDGNDNFALPDLTGAAPLGLDTAPGRPPVTLGQAVPGEIPGLGLNYLICVTDALDPPKGGSGDLPAVGAFFGQIVAFAGTQLPVGWAPCDGSLLSIELNPVLHGVIGTTYGGDGVSTFALPDLSGRIIQGKALRDR